MDKKDRRTFYMLMVLSVGVVCSLAVLCVAVLAPSLIAETQRTMVAGVTFLVGVSAMILLVSFSWRWSIRVKKQLHAIDEQNKRNQQAILLLLDEMTNLAEGDLTVHTTVTEDITGAIADSVNYSIDALRNLVTTINRTAVQVSHAAVSTQDITRQLTDSSQMAKSGIPQINENIDDLFNL